MKYTGCCFLFFIPLFLFSSCEEIPPLGGKVDKDKSGHFYKGLTRRKVYCKRKLTNFSLVPVRYEPVELAHAKTFTVINELTAYDKYSVFYRRSRQKNIDRASFFVNPYDMVCDRHGVYTPYYMGYEFEMLPVEGADPATFRLLTPICENRRDFFEWGKDESSVFLRTLSGKGEYAVREDRPFIKQAMDAPSFEILNHKIVADKDSVYFIESNNLISHPRMPGRLEALGPYVWNGDSIYHTALIEGKYDLHPVVQKDSIIGYERHQVYEIYAIEVKDPESVSADFDVENYGPESYGEKQIWIDGKLYNTN